jgi:RND family efflux transporter MFP subunit
MPQSINHHLDISQLKIDRESQIKSIWRSANITNALILLTFFASVLYLSAAVVLPTNDVVSTEVDHISNKDDQDKSLANPVSAAQALSINHPSQPTALKGKSTKQTSNTILDASGHIVARRIATVSSRVTGKLNQLHIEEGQQVKKSEILAELDDKQAVISHQLALAELSAKQAGFEEFKLLFKQQTQRFNRNESLAKQKLISEQLLEDSQFKNAQLGIQVKNKQALVQLAQQRVALAQYQLNQHKIRAPFDGVVISKNAQVGELISAGSSGGGFIRTGVGTIVDMSSLEIEVEVGESYINRVFVGQKVIAKLDAYPKWSINSAVVAVIPTADRQKASIKVRVKLFENDPRILPDMGVKVSFTNTVEATQQAHVAAL